MNSRAIKRVIADQAEELDALKNENLVERDILPETQKLLGESVAKVVTGVRRCGKSTLCRQLLDGKSYAYLNFDDERLLSLKSDKLNDVFELLLMEYPEPDYFFFDEIQNVAGWELFVNRLIRQGSNVVITGSNSKMLSRELATHLTGRHVQIELFPFSFIEFLKLKNADVGADKPFSTKRIAAVRAYLDEYIEYGGFPEIKLIENKRRYVRDLFDKIVLRDIVERYEVRDVAAMKELAVLMINYFSSLFTYNKLSSSLRISSANTVREFLSYFEETYLLNYARKFSYKTKEELRSPRKCYCVDTGFITTMGTSLSPNYGRKMENVVFVNEKRKGARINYYSDGASEVDFIVKDENGELKLIQVSKDISDAKTFDRETKALGKALKTVKAKKALLITESAEDEIKIDGDTIDIIPLWKYLLSD